MPYQVGLLFSEKDSELKDEFISHLFPYQRERFLEIVEEVNERELGSLDVLIAGISSSFLANEEAMRLWSSAVDQGLRCIPLILRPCAWEALPGMAKLWVAPKNGKPVVKWRSTDEALLNAAESVRRINLDD